MISKEQLSQILEALKAASDHLDYCGYGDSWERECAQASKLEERVASALKLGQDILGVKE